MSGQQFFRDVAKVDQLSRRDWSEALARIIIHVSPQDVLLNMVVEGKRAFEGKARPIAAGHAFHQADFDRMFDLIAAHVRRQGWMVHDGY